MRLHFHNTHKAHRESGKQRIYRQLNPYPLSLSAKTRRQLSIGTFLQSVHPKLAANEMGTRGYYIYRYKGRYYAHYNHWDSYPSGLGSLIVEDIPTNPEAYEEWLNQMRTQYAEFDKILEEQILTVTDADLSADVDLSQKPQDEDHYKAPKREVLINEMLDDMPSVLPDASNDLFIEWVYTIDLDREVFSVDNGAHFRLGQIPRDDDWIKALTTDAHGKRTIDIGLVPEECVANPVLATILPDPSLLNAYGTLTTKPVRAKATLDLNSEIAHSYLIRLSVWRMFASRYGKNLGDFLYGWEPHEFVFRELVHAVVCLASGDPDNVRYMPSENLKAVTGEGYRWFKGENGNPILLPNFMDGCHRPGIEPGICPTDAPLYWFGGVVVCPAVRLDSNDHRNAAIAKAVAFGKESGRNWFDAVLISIEHVVLLRLLPGDVVEHTDAITLFSIRVHTSMYAEPRPPVSRSSRSPSRSRSSDAPRSAPGRNRGDERSDPSDPIDETANALQKFSPGFVALIHLFDGAAYSQLKPLTAKQSVFPAEIMYMILPYTDDETYHKCAKASRHFRYFCQRNLRIFDDYTILNYKPQMKFAILNRKTGVVEQFLLSVLGQHYERKRKTTNWCPVIGVSERLGYLSYVEISFLGLVAQPRPNVRTPPRTMDIEYQLQPPVSNPYLIKQHLSLRTCVEAWERYIRSAFPMHTDRVSIRKYLHEYRLPPNTGLIHLHRSPDIREKEVAALWAWLKRPSDDREEMWGKGLSQAEKMLRKSKVKHSMWLLLVFGNRVRAFRWEPLHDKKLGDDGSSGLLRQGERLVENKKDPETRKSRDEGADNAEPESKNETQEPNTTLTEAEGKQKAISGLEATYQETRRNLISKLDGRTLNITIKEDSETIIAFLKNARDSNGE